MEEENPEGVEIVNRQEEMKCDALTRKRDKLHSELEAKKKEMMEGFQFFDSTQKYKYLVYDGRFYDDDKDFEKEDFISIFGHKVPDWIIYDFILEFLQPFGLIYSYFHLEKQYFI